MLLSIVNLGLDCPPIKEIFRTARGQGPRPRGPEPLYFPHLDSSPLLVEEELLCNEILHGRRTRLTSLRQGLWMPAQMRLCPLQGVEGMLSTMRPSPHALVALSGHGKRACSQRCDELSVRVKRRVTMCFRGFEGYMQCVLRPVLM